VPKLRKPILSGFLPISPSQCFSSARASMGTRELGKAVRRRSPTCQGSRSGRPVTFSVDMSPHPLTYDRNYTRGRWSSIPIRFLALPLVGFREVTAEMRRAFLESVYLLDERR